MYIYYLPIFNNLWHSTDIQLLSFISPQRQKTVLSYKYTIDKKLSLYSALLVRMEISILSGMPNNDLLFYNEFMHKPILLSAPQYHFNISHTHNMVLCGISINNPIGVDVECTKRNEILEKLEDVFHPMEVQYIKNSTSNNMYLIRFYKIWTQKEAYIKYLGTGFSEKTNTLNTLDPILSSHLLTWQQENYICSSFLPTIERPNIKRVTESDIINYFLYSHS